MQNELDQTVAQPKTKHTITAMTGVGALIGTGIVVAASILLPTSKAAYTPSQCQRLALIDKTTAQLVTGAEDLHYDQARGVLYISAYDRRAAEKAAKDDRSSSIPTGGIYTLSDSELRNAVSTGQIRVKSLGINDDIAGGLRPHGLTFDPDADEIVFVNRAYRQIGETWKRYTTIERIGTSGELVVTGSLVANCHANDLTVLGNSLVSTFDHQACGWKAGLEDVFNLRRSGVHDYGRDIPLISKVGYANGIATLPDGRLAVAATREKSIRLYDVDHARILSDQSMSGLEAYKKISVPGGPDNLTIGTDGSIIAAVHPSLLRMGLHRKLGWKRAPSRIVKIDPETRHVTTLFDDPGGRLFSAATVAVETDHRLVVGSVTDEGLLVCEAAR